MPQAGTPTNWATSTQPSYFTICACICIDTLCICFWCRNKFFLQTTKYHYIDMMIENSHWYVIWLYWISDVPINMVMGGRLKMKDSRGFFPLLPIYCQVDKLTIVYSIFIVCCYYGDLSLRFDKKQLSQHSSQKVSLSYTLYSSSSYVNASVPV